MVKYRRWKTEVSQLSGTNPGQFNYLFTGMGAQIIVLEHAQIDFSAYCYPSASGFVRKQLDIFDFFSRMATRVDFIFSSPWLWPMWAYVNYCHGVGALGRLACGVRSVQSKLFSRDALARILIIGF